MSLKDKIMENLNDINQNIKNKNNVLDEFKTNLIAALNMILEKIKTKNTLLNKLTQENKNLKEQIQDLTQKNSNFDETKLNELNQLYNNNLDDISKLIEQIQEELKGYTIDNVDTILGDIVRESSSVVGGKRKTKKNKHNSRKTKKTKKTKKKQKK